MDIKPVIIKNTMVIVSRFGLWFKMLNRKIVNIIFPY